MNIYEFEKCDCCNGTGYDANADSCEKCNGAGEIRPDTPPEGWPVEVNYDYNWTELWYSCGTRTVLAGKQLEIRRKNCVCEIDACNQWRYIGETEWRN